MQSPQQAATEFLKNILTDERGSGYLHGPETSGKSLLIRQLVQELQPAVAVADIDGTGLKSQRFLLKILEQFGYRIELDSSGDILNMLRVIAVHLTRSDQAPVLIVRNINRMYPSSLSALCTLAAQKVGKRFALRIILVGDRYFSRVINSPNMRVVADRLIGSFALTTTPAEELPRLIVTLNGKTLQDVRLSDSIVLIGRSDFCDIFIDNQRVSRHHALAVRDEGALILFDLNSSNGTFVNSNPMSSAVLRDSDIISIGDYRIKVINPAADAGGKDPALADTARMRSIEDLRQERLRECLSIAATSEQKA